VKPEDRVLRRYHLVGAQHAEIFRDQRIGGDRLADREGDLDRIGDQPVAFQLHLPACHIEARDQLLVGAGRCMGENGFVELGFHRVEVHVLDE